MLRVDPDNVEARTYAGWLLSIQAGEQGKTALVVQAEGLLDDAIRLGPTRADAYCFKAVVRFRYLNDAATAKTELARCQALDPPGAVAGLIGSLGQDIDAELRAPQTTAPATPPTSAAPASATP